MEPATGEAESPALALVNTLRTPPGGETDDIATTTLLDAWLREHDLAAPIHSADVARFAQVRQAARALLLARINGDEPDPAMVAAINAVCTGTAVLHWQRGADPAREWRWDTDADADRALAIIAADVITLLTERTDHLAACAAPGCIRLMLRTHGRRQWCGKQCGDRVRASRHYQRKKP